MYLYVLYAHLRVNAYESDEEEDTCVSYEEEDTCICTCCTHIYV
jgi:hypothetical protein